MKKQIILLTAAAASLALAKTSNAASIGWDSGGGIDTEWSTAANWAGDVVPGTNQADRADFFSGTDVGTVTSAVSSTFAVDIFMRNNGKLTISADMDSIRNISIGTTGSSAGFGTFVKQTAGTVDANNVLLGTDATNGGLYEISGTGALNQTGLTTVGANGRFSLIGSNASVAAGNGTGDNFTMQTTGDLSFTFDSVGIGTIAVADTFTINSVFSTLTLDLAGFLGTGSFDLVTFDTIAGAFDSGNISGLTGLSGGRSASITYDSDSMNLSIIPEPGTYALLAGLSGLAFVMMRRRKA